MRTVFMLGAIGALAAALVVPALLDGFGAISGDADRIKARNDLRVAAIQGIGVLAVLLAGWYTARTYRLGREGQLTERFKAGVELLSGQGVDITGGILALERVARDSPRDHSAVIELLALYARTPGTAESDLRTALQSIGRRELRHDRRAPFTIDLTHLAAPSMTLNDLNLNGADLSESRLEATVLTRLVAQGARFRSARLLDANLEHAVFDDADLTRANLSFALLNKARLRRAILRQADATGALLVDADLVDANLTQANLRGAQLQGARLDGADLTAAVLRAATGEDASFVSAKLVSSDASGAVLLRADLRKASLNDANFDGAILEGADFRGADVTGASFVGTDLTGTRRGQTVGQPADIMGAQGIVGW